MFRETDCSHFWLIDADVTPPVHALVSMLRADVDVIAADVKVMKLDSDRVEKPARMLMTGRNGRYYEQSGYGVKRIDRAGFGCVMIRRSVFDAIPFPWFEERPWGAVRGTDFIFCEKMEQASIPLHGHFDVVCSNRVEVELG